MNLRLILICNALAAALCGCFTGIESTPRITENDVRQSGVKVSPEQTLVAAILPEPPASWHKGKKWIVDNDRIAMIFTSASGNTAALAGDTLVLVGTAQYPDFAGKESLELVLQRTAGSDTLYYRPDVKIADLGSRTRLDIPFAVELAPVEMADSILSGKTYFITTPAWADADGNAVDGLRHIPVTVTSITAGTVMYPLKVEFMTADAETPHYIMMTYGVAPTATRNFERIFSLTDPRLNYPRIQADVWDKIIRSQVDIGMSRDECRLALGAPASVNRGASNAGQYERWNYDNGIYLIFEDGVLIKFRK